MYTQKRNKFVQVANTLDKSLGTRILPRDRIFISTASSPTKLSHGSVLLDVGDYGYDMFYYIHRTTRKQHMYTVFHATALRGGIHYSSLVILKEKQNILSLDAQSYGFEHFSSPQLFWLTEEPTLFFCARKNGNWALYRMELPSFVATTPRKLLAGVREQWILVGAPTRIFTTTVSGKTPVLYTTSAFKNYTKQKTIWDTRSPYAFINNPTVLIVGNTTFVYARMSTKNALTSHIVLFTSKNGRTYVQQDYTLQPLNDLNQRHGTAFPSIRRTGKVFELCYTGFWGRHLLEKYTIAQWSKR